MPRITKTSDGSKVQVAEQSLVLKESAISNRVATNPSHYGIVSESERYSFEARLTVEELGAFLVEGTKVSGLKSRVIDAQGRYNPGSDKGIGYRDTVIMVDKESRDIYMRRERNTQITSRRVELDSNVRLGDEQVYVSLSNSVGSDYQYQFICLFKFVNGSYDITKHAYDVLDIAKLNSLANSPRVSYEKLGHYVVDSLVALAEVLPVVPRTVPWAMGSKRNAKKLADAGHLDPVKMQKIASIREGGYRMIKKPRVQYR